MTTSAFLLSLLILLVSALVLGSYFLFRDTLNRIQYIETLRLYWITKDDGRRASMYQPRFMRAFMRQTEAPYWRGSGVQARFHRWTFQVGKLTHKASGLEYQVGESGWLPTDPRLLDRFDDDTSF